jgi:hypothetical protein
VPERFGEIPWSHGLVFTCVHCSRHTAVTRDALLKAFGDHGVIREVAARLRCRGLNCKDRRRRGMHVALTPLNLSYGSKRPKPALDALVDTIQSIKPAGTIQ